MILLHAILALLSRGPRHGYRLRTDLASEFGPDWSIDRGQLYRLLSRLERDGWAAAYEEVSDSGPRRKVYRITRAGRAELRRWTRSPDPRHERGRDPFLVKQLVDVEGTPLRLRGSDDLLLSSLCRELAGDTQRAPFSSAAIGSLGGLMALRNNQADIAGTHLLDVDSGTYNVSFVRHLFPEERIVIVHLARREQGLFVPKDNPGRLRSVRDLTRKGVRYINRQRDAGTRLFVLHALRKARVAPQDIAGYTSEVATHDEVAEAVARGDADVGPGIRAVADKWDLGFVPLGEESFDLAMPEALYESERIHAFLELLHAPQRPVPIGYDTTRMGRVVARSG